MESEVTVKSLKEALHEKTCEQPEQVSKGFFHKLTPSAIRA